MPNVTTQGTLRLVLVPSIVTLFVSVLRVVGERQHWFPVDAGGSATWLGITWLGFLFGAWFARQLRNRGSAPRVRRPWLWSLLSLLPLVAAGMLTMPPVLNAASEAAGREALRVSGFAMSVAALVAASVQFVVWPRLAWTLLCYAIPARLGVVAITWLAEHEGWDTHYTKFGPTGYDLDMADTMVSTILMQMGFWLGITITIGTLLGVVLFGRTRKA